MIKSLFLLMMTLAIALPYGHINAADDKAVKAQRREAQKERQQHKNERNKKNNEALREFRQFVKPLKKDYQQKVRELDTGFRLRKVDLNAEQQSKVAAAEAELHQSMTQMMLNPHKHNQQQATEKFRADMKAHSNKVYELKKQASRATHEALIENELEKHRVMSERDQVALEKATSLGLQEKHKPILATPIAGELNKNEQRWNEREKKDVEKMYDNNQRQLGEFIWGSKLREWEIQNMREDFKLEWQKKDELQALNSENNYYNLFLPQLANGTEASQQEVANRVTEINNQNRLINIKHQNINQKNKILRAEQKRKIMGR